MVRAAIGGAVGLLPYLYCFFVGQSDERFIWGDWDSLNSILFYFSGQDYVLNWAGEVDRFANLSTLLEHLLLDGSLVIILVGLGVGLKIKSARYLWIAWVTCGLILGFFVISNRIFFTDVPDYHGDLGPVIWGAIIGAAATIKGQFKRDWLVFLVLLCISNTNVERPVWHRDLSNQTLPSFQKHLPRCQRMQFLWGQLTTSFSSDVCSIPGLSFRCGCSKPRLFE